MEIWKQIETFKAKTTDRSFSIVSNMAQKGSTDDEAANTKRVIFLVAKNFKNYLNYSLFSQNK